jgi:hypothetical protein
MTFSVSQTFYIDPSIVQNAPTVGISRIDIFFKTKPQATNNKSGITNPGVNLFLVSTELGIPQVTNISNSRWVRVEYNDVNATIDGSVATRFKFDPPVPMTTGVEAALVLAYDGDEDFVPWTDVKGEYLVGTNIVSGGASGRYLGTYYSYISAVPFQPSNTASTTATNMVQIGTASSVSDIANSSYTATSWRSKADTALKFKVYAARYAVNGSLNLSAYVDNTSPSNSQITTPTGYTTTANGEYVFTMPQERIEYIAYDRINSNRYNTSVGERAFPVLPFYPAGDPVKVTLNAVQGANSITATGNVNFTTLLSITGNQPEYFIIQSENHLGPGADVVNVRQVTNIVSNTQVQLDQALSFTNAVAKFYRAPVAVISQFKTARFFGSDLDVVILKNSTANSSMRFTPFSVSNVDINTGGTGYANTDYITINGYESVAGKVLGNYSANANLRTNANGTITSIYLANVGSGFSNVANVTYVIANTSGSNSVGTGANLAIKIGTNLKTEYLGFDGKGGNFANTRPINIDIGQIMPALIVNNPSGTFYESSIRYPYYSIDDPTVSAGAVTYCDPDNAWDILSLQTMSLHNPFEFSKRRTLPSWSNELWIPYANGAPCAAAGGSSNGVMKDLTSNASVLSVVGVSNNDFVAITAVPVTTKITYSRYIINNDATGEQGNYGNAWAKGIEVKFTLANNAVAEDLLLYATVYCPANTRILAYARIYNTQDNDSFDTKEWTQLQLRSGNNIVSSGTDTTDMFEMTWGLSPYPDVAYTISGSVTTSVGSAVITGQGTTFTSNVAAGDMVLIQNALFSNTYQVAIVNAVSNNTQLTINSPVSNLNMVGTGFTISKVGDKYQAFNNYLNDNVARYYSSTLAEFDGFNAAAIKMVMLTANGIIVPLIDDVRAVAVSS